MGEEKCMAERILRTIENIIINEPELREFTIIPTEGNIQNKSPVLNEENSLGLESWCIQHIYQYACKNLFEVRSKLSKGKLTYTKMENLNHLLMGALLINPDICTFWAMRRELVTNEISSHQMELHFAKIVLSYKSKSNEAFAHRRWVILHLLNKLNNTDIITRLNLLYNELGIAEIAASKSKSNYHAWTHRIWYMENINKIFRNFAAVDMANLIQNELHFSSRWLSHSEYTGYHYRQYLISTLHKNTNIKNIFPSYYKDVLSDLELDFPDHIDFLTFLMGKKPTKPSEETIRLVNVISILIYDILITLPKINKVFLENESLWYYRRYAVEELLKYIHEYYNIEFKHKSSIINNVNISSKNIVCSELSIGTTNTSDETGATQPKMFKSQPGKVESTQLYRFIVTWEKKFIFENSFKNHANFFQKEYSKRHEKWLKLFLGLDLC